MATRSYKPSEKYHVADGAEVLLGNAQKVTKDQLVPRIAERNKVAVDTVPTYIYLFPHIRAGRRCSCFDVETSADTLCRACFGTGVVGGFTKYGTELEVIDVTHPNLRTTNIIPDYSVRSKPVRFTLIDGAEKGTLEVKVELKSNLGIVDALASSFHIPKGTYLAAWMRAPNETDYVTLNKDNLAQRLFNPWVEIRVDFSRVNPGNESPKLDVIYLRYQTLKDPTIKANIPRAEKSIVLQEIGAIEDWQTMNFWTDASKVKSVTTEDFIMTSSGNTRWKVVLVKEFAPFGYNTSWDIETRLVQIYEPYAKVPAGITVNIDKVEQPASTLRPARP